MLRTLVFAGIAAVVARQLYKSGALKGFREDLSRRVDDLRKYADEKRAELKDSPAVRSGAEALQNAASMPALARKVPIPHQTA